MNRNVGCIGELLIDMFCTDVEVPLKQAENFKRLPGGAPANVAAMVANIGGGATFIGKVGKDAFGLFLIETLQQLCVDTSMIQQDTHLPTTMAFVSRDRDGERDFQFNRGADQFLKREELTLSEVLSHSIMHFGSATALLDGHLHETYMYLMKEGYKEQQFISFDPNYRADLWGGNESVFIKRCKECISFADFVKVSAEELEIITNEKDMYKGIDMFHEYGATIVAVTMGKEGSIISNKQEKALIPSEKVNSIDSTGAGDAFVGAVLYQFSEALNDGVDKNELTIVYLKKTVRFANKVAADVCTKIGSLTALPSIKDIDAEL